MSWPKKLIVAFFLGILTFVPLEILMARMGVLQYSRVDYLGLPLWLPIALGVVTMGAVFLFTLFDHLFNLRNIYQPNHLAFEYLFLVLIYVGVLLFRQYPYLLSISLLFLVLVRLIFFHRPMDTLYFLLGACLGPTLELVLTNLQLYLFTEPDFLGMPYWLPIFWGNVVLALRRVTWVLTPMTGPDGGVGGEGLKGL